MPIPAESSTIRAASSGSSVPSQPEHHKSNAKSTLNPKKSSNDKAKGLQKARKHHPASPMRPSTKRPLAEQREDGSKEAEPSTKKRRDGASACPARDDFVGRVGTEITGTGRAQFTEYKDSAEKVAYITGVDYQEVGESRSNLMSLVTFSLRILLFRATVRILIKLRLMQTLLKIPCLRAA